MHIFVQLGVHIVHVIVLLVIAVLQVTHMAPSRIKSGVRLPVGDIVTQPPTRVIWKLAKPTPQPPVLKYADHSDHPQFSEKDYWHQSNKTRPILKIVTFGRLGNQVFHYAASYCIALQTYRTPSIYKNSRLFNVFPNLSAKKLPSILHPGNMDRLNHSNYIKETGWSIYNKNIIEQVKKNDQSWLKGCFQSWKYMVGCEKALRREFTFNFTIQGDVYTHMREFAKHYMQLKGIQYHDITFVGLHVRLGDMLYRENIKLGYTTAPISYINNAMDYYNQKYKWPLFVAASEDIQWCKDYIKPPQNNVYFSPYVTENFDFTLLSSCNHSIITIGSYGWFTAWLAGGECVYYDNFPVPGSDMLRGVSFDDRYPPTWIGMS